MKVGTDGVLLGAWAEAGDPASILDIGCGSGLLALMMAQRFEKASISGIDIHPPSALQSTENFLRSPWADRLSASCISLQDFEKEYPAKFDLIITNPPFFNHSLLPPDPGRSAAKHTHSLSYGDLAKCVHSLLDEDGTFSLILPAENHDAFENEARKQALHKNRELMIRPLCSKAVNRIISEWSFKKAKSLRHELCIRKDPNTYTPEYVSLTSNFYLALNL